MRPRQFRALVPLALAAALASLFALPSAEAGKCANGTSCPASERDANGCCKAPAKPSVPTTTPSTKASVATSAKPAVSSASKPAVSASASVSPTPKCPAGMAAIPGGSYTLGKRGDAATVSAFCLDLTEVTVGAFQKCVDDNACTEPNAYAATGWTWDQYCNWKRAGRGLHPVNCLDWEQAKSFCTWAGKRLVTEDEWEWAARNGERADEYPWGAALPNGTQVNACGSECASDVREKMRVKSATTMYPGDDGWPGTAPVGSFAAGDDRWGVHDLSGNVLEWTGSALEPKSKSRVERGGGWDASGASVVTASHRVGAAATTRASNLGFRCAKSP